MFFFKFALSKVQAL